MRALTWRGKLSEHLNYLDVNLDAAVESADRTRIG